MTVWVVITINGGVNHSLNVDAHKAYLTQQEALARVEAINGSDTGEGFAFACPVEVEQPTS